MTEKNKVFDTLFHLDVNDRVEKKKAGKTQLSYLSWAWAWAEVKKRYPDAQYEILKFENNQPYVFDEKTGYMVFTKVTIEGIAHEMWLPVMDGANKAMKSEPYTYQVINWNNGKRDGFVDKSVEAASMFDVNKTIMRCLVKNLAMFGLGLYIYSGEDLPEEEPVKLVDDKQIASLNAVVKSIAELTNQEEEATKTGLLSTLGLSNGFESLDVNSYGLVLNKLNAWKKAYEKKAKEEEVAKQPDPAEEKEEPKAEQESILDRYGNPK